jgi:hypothetical protein
LYCNAERRLLRLFVAEKLIVEHPRNKASPQDSTEYSIQIEGQNNKVNINGQIMTNTPDSIIKKNKICVNGVGNTVNVTDSENKSEVIIQQKGNKNQINIIQNKK